MSVAEQLDEFVASIPDRCVVVLTDLSTGLALAAASGPEQAQEQIDALALTAKADWKSCEAQAVHKFCAGFRFDAPECVLSEDEQTITLSVSAPELGDEGLCIAVEEINVAVDLIGAAETVLTSLLTSWRLQ